MKYLKIIIISAILTIPSIMSAQNMSDMRLNEILIKNTNGYIDDYGNRSGWIEVFNSSYGTVDIAGCFLTDDPSNLKKYPIPKGDILTKIKPRQHALFFADGMATRGNFHLNFTLDSTTKEIIFVSSDGKTIIDKVNIPQNLQPDQSYGRVMDGEGSHEAIHFMKKSYNIYMKEISKTPNGGWAVLPKVTPSTNNFTLDTNSKADALLITDRYGIIMAITAMSVVFLALILLYVVFKKVGNNAIKKSRENERVSTGKVSSAEESSENNSAEVYAAISMAWHLYQEGENMHDTENTILTIHKESKSYSPWSSKIYTLRETPQLNKRR